jgi:class 3 adenylate cyclase/tetratricopeptide (TPR) repeat protein
MTLRVGRDTLVRMAGCTSCGAENPEGFLFCGRCGSPLEAAAVPRELRKTVTVVFCDLVGSTALGESVDPEALRARMARTFEELRSIVERHGGTVEKFIGDAVMAVFGIPFVHEDDALRAVRAAAELRDAVARHGLEARIGVNTGEVVAGGGGETLVTGDAVNVAARLEQAAAPGEVLLGAETLKLVRGAVSAEAVEPLDLKGKRDRVPAYRLLEIDAEAAAFARHFDAPLIGRERELAVLRQAFERAVSEQACHLFTVLGSAGVGKTRLGVEFLADLDATVLRGRCLDYGDGITFWPVVEVLKQIGVQAEPVLERIAQGGSSPQELFWEFRKLLERLAAERPLVVVFDDTHWAEPTFLDLIDHVSDLSRAAPILLLVLARPELLDERPGWSGGKLNATTILLEPLDPPDCRTLIAALDGAELGEATLAKIVEASEGNPLFIEEMLGLAREGGEFTVPSTIQALLAARLDRLATEERTVVERGAVEGKVFHIGAVQELAPELLRPDVETHLVSLVRKELIRPEPATVPNEEAFRFRHLLMRDAAYDALPKELRADLHERFADWLDAHAQDLVELDEIAGYHLEQAVRYRRELGATAEDTAALAAQAAARLDPAAQHAKARGDLSAAQTLLERTLALSGGIRRLELIVDLGEVLLEQGSYPEALELLTPLAAGENVRIAHHARALGSYGRLFSDPGAAMIDAQRIAEEAIAFFEEARDDLGLARAWWLLAWFHWGLGLAADTSAELQRAADHARLAGNAQLAQHAVGLMVFAMLFGPASPDEVDAYLRTAESESGGERIVECWVSFAKSIVAGRAGRFDEARAGFVRADATMRDFGFKSTAAAMTMQRAEIELLAEDAAEAERLVTDGISELETLGERSYLSTALALLAQILCVQGRFAEAEPIAVRARETGSKHDLATLCDALLALARVHESRGELDAALQAAREATEIDWGFVWYQAEAHLELAHIARGAGLLDEARESAKRAVHLYELKESSVMTERARVLLAEL